jgi:hypothetical protein
MAANYISILPQGTYYLNVTATGNTTSTSATYANISGMTLTPPAGTYLVIFSGNTSATQGSNGETGTFQLAVAGTQVTASRMTVTDTYALLGTNTVAGGNTLASIVTVTGTQAITAQFASQSGTIQVNERNLIAILLS